MKKDKFQERKKFKERPIVQDDHEITSLLFSTLLILVIVAIVVYVVI